MICVPIATINCSDDLASRLGWTIFDTPEFDHLLYWIERSPHFEIRDPKTGAQYLWVGVNEDARP